MNRFFNIYIMINHYATLELDNFISDKDIILKQYRKFALIYHPDLATGDVTKFHAINQAKSCLTSIKQKTEYDKLLRLYFNSKQDTTTNLIDQSVPRSIVDLMNGGSHGYSFTIKNKPIRFSVKNVARLIPGSLQRSIKLENPDKESRNKYVIYTVLIHQQIVDYEDESVKVTVDHITNDVHVKILRKTTTQYIKLPFNDPAISYVENDSRTSIEYKRFGLYNDAGLIGNLIVDNSINAAGKSGLREQLIYSDPLDTNITNTDINLDSFKDPEDSSGPSSFVLGTIVIALAYLTNILQQLS